MPKEKKPSPNAALVACFTELAQLEMHAGGKWQVSAYKKVAKALEAHPTKIRSGKEAAKLEGIGKVSASKIQEYLDNGEIAKLEELREEYAGEVKRVSKKDMKPTTISKGDRKKIKQTAREVMSLTANVMKNELRHNQQRMTGSKAELAQTIAEGRILGAIPKCTSCGVGLLKFDINSGMYTCPGGFDDDVYRPCGFISGNVDRPPWKAFHEEEESTSSESDSEETDES